MSLSESWASSGGGANVEVDLRTGTAQSIQAKLAADEARKHKGIWRDVRGWCWVARAPGRPGWSEGIGVGRMTFQKRERPGFDRWRFAWTRAKHFRRAADVWWELAQCREADRFLDSMTMGARYDHAADRADWGTRS